jgi:L-ascorbate metabolism protein UlaG (beta-lactamase superfamily)
MKYLFFLFLTMQMGLAQGYGLSDHYDGDRFFNPRNHVLKSFWEVMKWKMTSDPAKWPSHVENKNYPLPLIDNEKAILTFINHSTFLVQLPGLTILTDPIYSLRSSPVSFAGPKRVREPGQELKSLPKIDVVIVSHNHYDHLDLATLKEISDLHKPSFLVPLGDKKLLEQAGVENVRELDWWDEVSFGENKIVFAPAQHWSARGLFDKCKSLWGSYMIKGKSQVYFAGDTGYEEHFKTIKEKLGAPDIAILPIGAWAPRWFMKYFHLDPSDAILAHKDLGAKVSIGMHFGTFQLTDEGYYDSQEIMKELTEKEKLQEQFLVLDQGESHIHR